MEENRVAILAILVEDPDSVEALNAILHEYGIGHKCTVRHRCS